MAFQNNQFYRQQRIPTPTDYAMEHNSKEYADYDERAKRTV